MPALTGAAIRIQYRPRLRARRGRLVSGGSLGGEVHAGSFLKQRLIVLDSKLGREHARILAHEVAHFVWVRLGNPKRRQWEALIARERGLGEMGWSAEWRRRALKPEDRALRTRRWREYACESFCDTAAWLWARLRKHPEITLGQRARERRRKWFDALEPPLRA